MSTVVKDLGAVSAYAYAVEKGYTGTEAEFAELMADYAEVGQRAEDAADSALESKSAAQTAATTATNKASEATTAAQTATTKAGEASTSASTATSAKDTAVSASQTATSKAAEATTAAATATSAASTATTAKDDAVSAKTAAQTAQTGAETARDAVQSSAAQIATNASDITALKEDLSGITPTVENINSALFGSDAKVIFVTENGNIDNSGVPTSNNTYLRTSDFVPYNGERLEVVIDDGYEAKIIWYDSEKTYKARAILKHSNSPFYVTDVSYPFYKMTFKQLGGAQASTDWLEHIVVYDLDGTTKGFIETTNQKLQEAEAAISEMEPLVGGLVDHTTAYTEGDSSGYYRVYNGAIEERTDSTGWTKKRIEVESYMISVDFTIVSKISSTAVYCAFEDAEGTLIANHNNVGVNSIPIPSDAKYIYLSFFGDAYNSAYTVKARAYVTNVDLDGLDVENPYNGLKAVAFGTSLTYRSQTTGGFLQYLPQMSGMTVDNQGVGSSKIYGNAEDSILNKILNYANYTDKDVVLIEGFVNDWYNNSPLGDIYDTDNTTVCGCLYLAINHVLTAKDNITVVVILDHFGINANNVDMSASVTRNNIKQLEYYEKLADVCALYGIPCIKEYKLARMNQMTSRYYLDYIHLNPIGAKQSANVIWSKLRYFVPSI